MKRLGRNFFIISTIITSVFFFTEFISANKNRVNKNFRSDLYGKGETCYLKYNNINFFYNPNIGENTHYNDYIKARKEILAKSANRKTANPIPKITHHIWITDSQKPKEIKAQDLTYIKRSLDIANKEKGWRNIFWVNDRNLIPNSLAELASYGVEVKEINEDNLKNFVDIKNPYFKSFGHNYAESSDILRNAVLEEYGGFYLDVDYELKKIALSKISLRNILLLLQKKQILKPI